MGENTEHDYDNLDPLPDDTLARFNGTAPLRKP